MVGLRKASGALHMAQLQVYACVAMYMLMHVYGLVVVVRFDDPSSALQVAPPQVY